MDRKRYTLVVKEVKGKVMFTSTQVSKYIMYLCDENNIELSAGRLQIILFLLQRYYCDFHCERLISDPCYACVGPVFDDVDVLYPDRNAIVKSESFAKEKQPPRKYQSKIKMFLSIFFQNNGNKSEFRLIQDIQKDAAFRKARENKKDNEIYYKYFYEELQPYDD